MGGASSCCDDAPYLTEYFREYEKMTDGCAPGGNPFELLLNKNKMAEAKAEAEEHKEAMEQALRNAFDNHDSNDDGVLDEEESSDFFEHFVIRYAAFQKRVLTKQINTATALASDMFGGLAGMAGLSKRELARQCKREAQEQISLANEKVDERYEDYTNNEDVRNRAAFAFVDTNRDGQLQVEEVVKAFMPDTPENNQLLQALGFLDEQEAQLANELQKLAPQMEQDCPTQ